MAKDIKGVFQIFLKVNDSKKFKFNSSPNLHDIFLKDNSILEDLNKYKEVLFKIDNFELLIEKVDIFYINKNQEQDFFVVGEDEERKDEVIFFVLQQVAGLGVEHVLEIIFQFLLPLE